MKYGDALELDVGPQIMDRTNNMPLQMKMKMSSSPIEAPFDVESYLNEKIGIVPGEGGALDVLESSPKVREVSFGWSNPDLAQRGRLSYDRPTDPSAIKAIQDVDYTGLIKDSLLKLMDRARLSTGDVLVNNPVGLADGNFKRAKTYMREGFGMPDASSGQMYGKITGDGALSPVQIYSAEPALMENLKWKFDNVGLQRARAYLMSKNAMASLGNI